ncbi:hypothetical protein B9K06_19685 [Bacillus sp. OG2]|nr:hypothetical protein B9K06_19685 [Bacillus sp. OG2]
MFNNGAVDFRSRHFAFRGAALSSSSLLLLRDHSFAAAIPQESTCLALQSTGLINFFTSSINMAKNRFVTSQPIQSPFFKKHGAKSSAFVPFFIRFPKQK